MMRDTKQKGPTFMWVPFSYLENGDTFEIWLDGVLIHLQKIDRAMGARPERSSREVVIMPFEKYVRVRGEGWPETVPYESEDGKGLEVSR